MAYLSKEETKTIRNLVKDAFKGQGFKFSITNNNHDSVYINLLVSPFDTEKRQLNEIYPDYYEGDVRKLIETLNEITSRTKPQKDRNAGDMGADYPNMNYFKTFEIGRWDIPLEHKPNSKFNWTTIQEQLNKAIIKMELLK
jgi:hypothetical protein